MAVVATGRSRSSLKVLLVLILFGTFNILPWWMTGIHVQVRPSATTIKTVEVTSKTINTHGPRETKLVIAYPNAHKREPIKTPPPPTATTVDDVDDDLGKVKYSADPPLLNVDGDTGEVLGALGRAKVVTGSQLLEDYDSKRELRTCEQLPSNVSVKLTDTEMIGIKQIFIGANSNIDEYYFANPKVGKKSPSVARGEKLVKSAYAMMVSNHKYIDGAYVMAESLKTHSTRVQRKEVDVIIIVSDKIKPSVIQQLRMVFDRVIVLYSTAIYAPKSYYAPTFDKMYLWWLTWYEKVIFMDADTIASGNPDFLFDKAPPKDRRSNFLTAVGGSDYFQTALMVLYPSRALFTDIFLEFRFGTFGYNQWRARDGILLRTCFMPRHQNVPHPAQLHHYYGDVKPWFSKDMKHRRSRDKLAFDSYYKLFWDTFEEAHLKYFVPFFQLGGMVPTSSSRDKSKHRAPGAEHLVYGVTEKDKTVVKEISGRFKLDKHWKPDPTRYMWLQRYSKGSEYLRPTKAEYERLRNLTLPGLQIELSPEGQTLFGIDKGTRVSPSNTSCTAVCASLGKVCDARALYFSSVNSCDGLNVTVGGRCTSCTVDFRTMTQAHSPYLKKATGKKIECVSSFLHESPLCETGAPPQSKEHRVCPCVESSVLSQHPTRI